MDSKDLVKKFYDGIMAKIRIGKKSDLDLVKNPVVKQYMFSAYLGALAGREFEEIYNELKGDRNDKQ